MSSCTRGDGPDESATQLDCREDSTGLRMRRAVVGITTAVVAVIQETFSGREGVATPGSTEEVNAVGVS